MSRAQHGSDKHRAGHSDGGKGGARKSAQRGRAPSKSAGAYQTAKPISQRQLRVGEEIRHVLAQIFARTEFRDPDLAGVQITVTEVRISPDLKHATAFVARLGRSDIDEKLPALRRAAPFLRTQIAHEIRLRAAPDLTFQPDTALEYAAHIDELLHSPAVARDLESSEESEGEAGETEESAGEESAGEDSAGEDSAGGDSAGEEESEGEESAE